MMGFIVFLNKGGCACGGTRLVVTKRRYMRLFGLGVWGRGGVTMRFFGMETSIKTTKNTTRTSTKIIL